MNPRRPERSAVRQRTRTRPWAGPEVSAAAARTTATPHSPNFVIPFYSRERGRLAQLGERLPYKQEVGGSIPSPPIHRSRAAARSGGPPPWLWPTARSGRRAPLL